MQNMAAYRDYRDFWNGDIDRVLAEEMKRAFPSSEQHPYCIHTEVLTMFMDRTSGVDRLRCQGSKLHSAGDAGERILEAIEIARMTRFSALALGYEAGEVRLDVVYGDQIATEPEIISRLSDAQEVRIAIDSETSNLYEREEDQWRHSIERRDSAGRATKIPLMMHQALPVLMLYSCRSRPSVVIPSPNTVLLKAQLELDVIATDIERQRYYSPAQMWMNSQDGVGDNRFSVIRRSPEFFLMLDTQESAGALDTGLRLKEQTEYLELKLKTLAVSNGLSPTTFLPSRAETGAAKSAEYVDNTAVRRRNYYYTLRQVEKIRSWFDSLDVEIEIEVPPFYTPLYGDPLQVAQALNLRWQIGIDSPIEYVMQERGSTLDEAKKIVAINQGTWEKYGPDKRGGSE